MESSKRDAWLDGLRAVAVLLVLGRHVELGHDASLTLATWFQGGWVGVDLFFVLSGFLVSGLLFREYQQRRDLALARFLLRRGLRLYPAFYLLLAVTAVLAYLLPFPRQRPGAYLREALFVQNYAGGVWNHTWSLAVEEHFYLLLPLMLLWVVKRRRDTADPFGPLVPFTFLVMAALALVRCVHAVLMPFDPHLHLFATHLRIDSLMAGVLLAYVYQYRRAAFDGWVAGRRALLIVAGATCFVPAFVWPLETRFIHTLGLTLFAVGSVLLMAAGIGTAPLAARLLAPIGRASYSIYLWHMPVLIWGVPLCADWLGLELHGPWRIGLYLAGSIGIGSVMAWLTEVPIMRLRDRWFPANKGAKPRDELGRLRRCLPREGNAASGQAHPAAWPANPVLTDARCLD